MEDNHVHQPDYGTGQKKLSIYIFGLIVCAILTLFAFWVVIAGKFTDWQFTIIYTLACIQFLVQVICFLRLNTLTKQGRMNIMSFIFTGVVLLSIVVGSLWIMWNLNFYMMH